MFLLLGNMDVVDQDNGLGWVVLCVVIITLCCPELTEHKAKGTKERHL